MTLLVALLVLGRGAAAAAESRAGNASDLDAYFSLAASIWSPQSAAGKCLEQQRREGFAKKGSGSNFKTVGVEGVGHHWLEALPRDLCGGGGRLRRCGGQASFSACGGCCKVSTKGGRVEYGKAPQRARRGHAWRCFEGDSPNYPKLDKGRHHVVLVRDVTSTLESILRRVGDAGDASFALKSKSIKGLASAKGAASGKRPTSARAKFSQEEAQVELGGAADEEQAQPTFRSKSGLLIERNL